MCSYNITINDTIIDKVRLSFPSEQALEQWLQQQLEAMILDYHALLEKRVRARKAIELMRAQSEENGNSKMTLDEINEEIRLARKGRKTANSQ